MDAYDIPGGWEVLMEKYYDVMYSESYDWWTLALAFDAPGQKIGESSIKEFDQKFHGREMVFNDCPG